MESLVEAMPYLGRKLRGFDDGRTMIFGVETRRAQCLLNRETGRISCTLLPRTLSLPHREGGSSASALQPDPIWTAHLDIAVDALQGCAVNFYKHSMLVQRVVYKWLSIS